MLSAFVAAVTAIGTALGEISKAFSVSVAWQQSQQMVLLGQLQQQVPLLQAEITQLKAQNAALIAAAGQPGSNRL